MGDQEGEEKGGGADLLIHSSLIHLFIHPTLDYEASTVALAEEPQGQWHLDVEQGRAAAWEEMMRAHGGRGEPQVREEAGDKQAGGS